MRGLRRLLRRTLGAEARERALVQEAGQREAEVFARMGWSYESAVARLEASLPSIGRVEPFRREVDSIHWVLIAAMSLEESPGMERILEIGTHNGRFARLAAELFPRARVLTVDLPETDPAFAALYPDTNARAWTRVRDARAANLQAANIEFRAINSFFLPAAVEGGFDLVWVDAGHTYPEVAWDCCNAYHLCRDGGILMTDDILPDAAVGRTGMVSRATWEMLDFMDARGATRTELFMKRINGDTVADPRARKYVGVSRVSKRDARQESSFD